MNTPLSPAPQAHTNGTQRFPAFPMEQDAVPPRMPTPAVAEAGAHREADPLTHPRDEHGNRLPWSYAAGPAWVDDVPAYETDMKGAIAFVEQHDPLAAREMGHFYDQRLLPTLRRLVAIRDEEERKAAQNRAQADGHNRLLEEEETRVNQDDRDALAAVEEQLSPAHEEAGRLVARAGGEYDPAAPTAEAVLRVHLESAESLAGELRLPATTADQEALLHPAISWSCSVAVGAMIGISLGLMSRMVPSGNWLARPVPLAFCLAGGLGAAILGKWAIKHSARAVSQRYWLGYPVGNWGPLAVASLLITTGVVVMDACVEREGLMAGVRLTDTLARAAGNGTATGHGSEALYFLMAMILTFGYAVNAWWEGYVSGRKDACANRVRHAQELRFTQADKDRRAEGMVQEALEALARVRILFARHAELTARIAERAARLDARRLSAADGLSPDGLRRVQDAADQLNLAQAQFDALFTEAKIRYGAGRADGADAGGFWNWLLLSLESAAARGRRKRGGHRSDRTGVVR